VSMKKMQEKSKIYNIHVKAPTPPLKPSHMDGKTPIFQLKRVATKTQGFLMTKGNTPPEAKANHKLLLKPRQMKSSVNLNKRC
jgi:hypothetical protein